MFGSFCKWDFVRQTVEYKAKNAIAHPRSRDRFHVKTIATDCDICYDRKFMSGNSTLHYNSAPAIIIAIPTAIRSNLHTNEPPLPSSCTRVKYRMTIEQIMRGMPTACRVILSSFLKSVHSAQISIALCFISRVMSLYCILIDQALIFDIFWMRNGRYSRKKETWKNEIQKRRKNFCEWQYSRISPAEMVRSKFRAPSCFYYWKFFSVFEISNTFFSSDQIFPFIRLSSRRKKISEFLILRMTKLNVHYYCQQSRNIRRIW